MITSEARILANRQNALRSTGPKTLEGKENSRRNGLKHGLTGSGVVVHEVDLAEVDRRHEDFLIELDPQSSLGTVMVRQLAALSVRMERSQDQESRATSQRVRHAADDFDRNQFEAAETHFDQLSDSPRINLRKLKRTPEGVERLLESWGELRDDLIRDPNPTWTARHRDRAENLSGRKADDPFGSRFDGPSKDALGLDARAGDEAALQARSRARLLELIDSEIAGLEDHYESLDFERIKLDRAEASHRALFDPSREASLARRYESEATRGFFKALKELQLAEAEFAERQIQAATPAASPTPAAMASSRSQPSPTPREPQPSQEPERPASVRGPMGNLGNSETLTRSTSKPG